MDKSTAPHRPPDFGSLAFGILTFGLIEALKADPSEPLPPDNDAIDYNDLKHGVFVIITKDVPPRVIVVDDVTKTYWVRRGSSSELSNTAEQMVQLHGDFLSAQSVYSLGQQDTFIQQWKNANAQTNPSSTGSGTSLARFGFQQFQWRQSTGDQLRQHWFQQS